MRKHRLFTLLFLSVIVLVQAQSHAVTIYGFRQQSIGGMQRRGTIGETGNRTTLETEQVFQYAIYLTSPFKTRVYPIQLWLNGKAYSVKAEQLTETPMAPLNSDAPITVRKPLLPKNAGVIWRLRPLPLKADKSSTLATKLARKNAVVLLYKTGGRLQYGVLKKFTNLDENVLQ